MRRRRLSPKLMKSVSRLGEIWRLGYWANQKPRDTTLALDLTIDRLLI